MFHLLALAAILVFSLATPADSIEAESAALPAVAGLWLTHDQGGVIAISPCGGAICARIAGVVLDHPSDPMPLDYRGVSQCGLPLIADARQVRPALWKGHILDPRNGSLFGVELWLKDANHLALRGFLGFSLLGRTEEWTRYTGIVPSDCRLLLRSASD
jgi:uncharacterized protein (DUF2147 family)